MRLPIGLSLLFLLAPPLAAQGGAVTPLVHAGSLEVEVDPATVSFLPVDSGTLAGNLCSGKPPGHWPGTLTPRGECDLSVSPAPRIGFFARDSVADGTSAVPGSVRVSLQPASWEVWTGTLPVSTPCGLWDVSMSLDTEQEQPVSELALEPSPGLTAQGVFAGVTNAAVLYRFVERSHGTTLELPAVLPLELAGHWAAVPPEISGTLGDDASNLLLFAGTSGGSWTSFATSATWGGTGCHVGLRPPNVLDTLNGAPAAKR
jgi:hypothetical protein